jgi:GntR family transcriptional repressor for pyruvate dehydrogenase complex
MEADIVMIKSSVHNLPEKLSADILKLIIDADLRPGDKLPNEMVFSKKFNAGRSSVREAMKLLMSKNIINIRQGSGTYVAEHPGISEDPLGLVFLENNPRMLYDLLEIRILVEPTIAAMAAKNASAYDIKRIADVCSKTESLIMLGQNFVEADTDFHKAVAAASKNLIAPRLVPMVGRTIRAVEPLMDQRCSQDAVRCHRAVADAIASHDMAKAKDYMYLHIACNRRLLSEKQEGQIKA